MFESSGTIARLSNAKLILYPDVEYVVKNLELNIENINKLLFPNSRRSYPFIPGDFKFEYDVATNVELYYYRPKKINVIVKFVTIKFQRSSTDRIHESCNEIDNQFKALSSVRNCSDIVNFYGFCILKDHALFVMEAMECSLSDYIKIHKERNEPIEETKIGKIVVSIVRALNFCEEQNIFHRDIKPQNILLNHSEEFQVKLADFDVAKMMEDTMKGEVSTFMGTPMYMPPERFANPNYDRGNDIWSLGVVIAESAHGEYPFKNKMPEDHSYRVEDNYNKARLQVLGTIIDEKFFQECFGEKYSEQLKDFTKKCLLPFEERPKKARELMGLAFYKTHCESLEDEQPCSSNQLVNQPTNPTSDQNRTQENTVIPAPDQVESHDDNGQDNALDISHNDQNNASDISHNDNDQISTPDISHNYSDQINDPLIEGPNQHLNRIPNKKMAIILIVTILIILCILTLILILPHKNKDDEMQTSTSSMTSALPTTTISTTTPTIKCPDGSKWIHWNKTNACYYVDQGTISWHTAKRDCRKLDSRSNLTSIISPAEDEFIQSVASPIYPHPSKIAIGLHAQDAILGLYSYEWVDKTAINYTNWRTDPTKDTNEHCVFKEAFDGKWNWNIESSCTMEIPIIYVCKIKLH